VVQSRHETKEIYHGLGDPGAVGIPGVSSNSASPPVVGKTPPRADQYEHSETTAEYRISRQVERTLRPPGQLKRLSVAVFVDEKAKTGKPDELKSAVAAAAGLDPQRGDTVVISLTPFEPPAGDEKGSKVFAVRDFYFTVGRDLAAIVLAALFLKFVSGMIRKRAPGQRGLGAPAGGAAEVTQERARQEAAAPTPSSQPALTSFDPDKAAAVLRGWLNSEPGRREETVPAGTGTTPRGSA
jgi:flagellar M-ring protein FliF